MHDLNHVLDIAAGDTPPNPPGSDDLTRAQHALTRRKRQRYSAGLAALTAAAVIGVGGAVAVNGTEDGRPVTTAPADGSVRLVAETFDATPYTFDLTPQGWHVQGRTPSAVTIVPDDGSADPDVNVFTGKLVILFDANPLTGRPVTDNGRTFHIESSSDYTTISTPTLPDEPDGVVRIQFPASAGWTEASMIKFLGSVHVGAGAEQGVG